MLRVHPKTLMRYGLLAWTRFRLILKNAEALSGLYGWDRDCRPDSGRVEQPESWAWYKLSWKHQQLGGVSQTLERLSLFLAGAVAVFWGIMERGWPSEQRAINYAFLDSGMFLALMKLYRAVQLASPFLVVADVAPNHPQKKCWKLAFRSMFLIGIKSQRFVVSSFSKFYYTLQKKPFATPRTVLDQFKNPFVIGRNSARFSYHTDLSRFVLPVSDPSALNFSQSVGFQNFPK